MIPSSTTEDPAIPFPELQERLKEKALKGSGERLWTRRDESAEEQSTVVFVAGFFVTHCSTSAYTRSVVGSRHDVGFDGWDTKLEPPYGRPSEWEDESRREGRPPKKAKETGNRAGGASSWHQHGGGSASSSSWQPR